MSTGLVVRKGISPMKDSEVVVEEHIARPKAHGETVVLGYVVNHVQCLGFLLRHGRQSWGQWIVLGPGDLLARKAEEGAVVWFAEQDRASVPYGRRLISILMSGTNICRGDTL